MNSRPARACRELSFRLRWRTLRHMNRLPALLIGVALLASGLGGCSDACSVSEIGESANPGGSVKAVMFQRDCGATTGRSTQVSLVRSGSPSGHGNAFVADDGHGAAATGSWGGPLAQMEWLSADHLLVRYADKARLFDHKKSVVGVRISYQPIGG